MTVGLDSEALALSLTLHHLMRGWVVSDLLLDLPTHTHHTVCNKHSSTPASNATSETDRSVDGEITPHPAALPLFPSVSKSRVITDVQVNMKADHWQRLCLLLSQTEFNR